MLIFDNFLTFIVFLVTISILVLIHEFGHYFIGRKAGVGVKEFALGLPFTKPLWSKILKNGMKLSLYPLLFGGFVNLLGEEGPADAKAKAGIASPKLEAKAGEGGVKGEYFYKVNVWKRIAVVVAGVIMNFILGIFLFYVFLNIAGYKSVVPKLTEYNFISPHQEMIAVSNILVPTPASEANLAIGDVIINIDGKKFQSISDFQTYVKEKAGQPISFTLSDLLLTQTRTVDIIPRKNPPPEQGPLGIAIAPVIILNYPTILDKITSGLTYSIDMVGYNISVLGSFISSSFKTRDVKPLADSVSGPVGILSLIGEVLKLGGIRALLSMLNLTALLSLSLAVMNILPIPAMDGGRLAFLLVEAVSGKKLSPQKEALINQIGMAALLGLIFLITFNDIYKWIAPLMP